MPRQIFDDDEPLLDYGSMDELSELGIGDRGYASPDPPYGANEIFGDQFERRARELQRAPANLQPVNIIDAKTGAWTGNNQLGITQRFAPDANNLQTILKLDEWGFPEVWTIALGINDYSLEDAPFDISFAVTALIDFGSGGATQSVEIDWLQGASICLPMNAVNVRARYTVGTGEVGSSVPQDLRLTVTLSRGRTRNARPICSVRPPRQNTFHLEIPKFSKNLFISSELSLPGVTPFGFYTSGNYVQFKSSNLSASSVSSPTYLTSQFVSFVDVANSLVGGPQWIPIPQFARFIRFLDPAGNEIEFPGCVAHFEIGI